MDAVLTALLDRWLGADTEGQRIDVVDAASVAVVRERVRAEAAAIALPEPAAERLVNVASELGHNQLAHAYGGTMAVRRVSRGDVQGLEVIAADNGGGIASPREAFKGEPQTPTPGKRPGATSLGVGLAAVLELADEIDVDVRVEEGTCVRARKYASPVARGRQIGVYGRPYPGETKSGDDALFVRKGDALLVAVIDGLGHGVLARDAALPAAAEVVAAASEPFPRIFERAHEALRTTRGAVMSLARVDGTLAVVESAGVGNVGVQVCGVDAARRFAGSSFVLGAPGKLRQRPPEERPFGPRDALVLYTDGITTQMDLDGQLDLLHEHPVVIAQWVVERFGRSTDDALVLVVR